MSVLNCKPEQREGDATFVVYVSSLLWTCIIAGSGVAAILITSTLFDNLYYGNPFRNTVETIETVTVMPPLMALTTAVGTLLVFAAPQSFQALVAWITTVKMRLRPWTGLVAVLPVTVILSWYSWDYLTPSLDLGINEGADWRPYEHGLTFVRYLKMLAFQIPETLFTIAYASAPVLKMTRWQVVAATFFLVVLCACVTGLIAAGPVHPQS